MKKILFLVNFIALSALLAGESATIEAPLASASPSSEVVGFTGEVPAGSWYSKLLEGLQEKAADVSRSLSHYLPSSESFSSENLSTINYQHVVPVVVVATLGLGLYKGYNYYSKVQDESALIRALNVAAEIMVNAELPQSYLDKKDPQSPNRIVAANKALVQDFISVTDLKDDAAESFIKRAQSMLNTISKIRNGDNLQNNIPALEKHVQDEAAYFYTYFLKIYTASHPLLKSTITNNILGSDFISTFNPNSDAETDFKSIEKCIQNPPDQENTQNVQKYIDTHLIKKGWFTTSHSPTYPPFQHLLSLLSNSAAANAIKEQAKTCRLIIFNTLSEDSQWKIIQDYVTQIHEPFELPGVPKTVKISAPATPSAAPTKTPASMPARRSSASSTAAPITTTTAPAHPERSRPWYLRPFITI